MPPSIASLRVKRGQLKTKLTNFEKYLNALPEEETLNAEQLNMLELRLERMINCLDEFENIQGEILTLCEDAEKENEEKEGTEYEERYYTSVAKARKLLKGTASDTASEVSSQSSSQGSNQNQRSEQQNVRQIKFPTINLPKFNGKFENWLEFKELFEDLVDNNSQLSNIDKLHYLKSCLTEEAAEMVRSINLTNDNYKTALDILRDRYEDNNMMVFHHVKAIFEFPSIGKENSADLRALYNNVTKNLRALKSLKEPTDHWDTLIIYILTSKFDAVSQREWELHKYQGNRPTMDDIKTFVNKRCQFLEKMDQKKEKSQRPESKNRARTTSCGSIKQVCINCRGGHWIYGCEKFLKMSINERIKLAKTKGWCLNCLRTGHTTEKCTLSRCRKCNKAHNSLLHLDYYFSNKKDLSNGSSNDQKDPPKGKEPERNAEEDQTKLVAAPNTTKQSQVVLATAVVKVRDRAGNYHNARVFLDNGSQSNYISEEFCKKLNLTKRKVDYAVTGIGQLLTNVKGEATIQFKAINNNFGKELSCLVMPRVVDDLPTSTFDPSDYEIPPNIKLADPNFHIKDKIDVVFGNDIYNRLLCVGQIRYGKSSGPVLQKTLLGWIFSGALNVPSQEGERLISCLSMTQEKSIDLTIRKFWEVEECKSLKQNMNQEDLYCEEHFAQTYSRNEQGRFVVEIPFTEDLEKLGRTKEMAMKRFNHLEAKLSRSEEIKKYYVDFMQEYADLGHMTVCEEEEEPSCYLPHHAVIKESSLTTKCRVVFDASAKSNSGVSLNECQLKGPTIQADIFTILTRFRTHPYVLSADISKMYRQILVKEEQRKWQKILWRENPDEPVKTYKLNTVTYGTASAPFLAIRSLHQLGEENKENFPESAKIIQSDFYVDDLLTGTNSKKDLIRIQVEISEILKSAGFELRKWLTNEESILEELLIDKEIEASIVQLGENENNKTLGVFWNPKTDTIEYSVNNHEQKENISKRTILSISSQVFDPLGLVAPIIIKFKLIIQELWKLGLTWDEAVPQNIHTEWNTIKKDLQEINNIRIPRCVMPERTEVELNMFCDASEKAYGACAYYRIRDKSGAIYTHLVCAKSKVAPLSQITLPRLELCGALLAARLKQRICDAVGEETLSSIVYWSDSTIALGWIKSASRNFKTFVANRVGEIQELTKGKDWHHVKSKDNPADLISRGAETMELKNSDLWWHGPAWLRLEKEQWDPSQPTVDNSQLPEQRIVKITLASANVTNEFIEGLSSDFWKWVRMAAIWRRFLYNTKTRKALNQPKKTGMLKRAEIEEALNGFVRLSQQESFPRDYKDLIEGKPLQKRSRLLSLNPFLDKDNIIRVGGRLSNSNFRFEKKHPAVLGPDHKLTVILVTNEHLRLLHCGPNQMLSSIREKYWPILGRNLCKKIVRECIDCVKADPTAISYLMGNLPTARVEFNPPFVNTGLDYAGPVMIKDRKLRGAKMIKAYICVFICMCVKAIHLELLTDLSTNAFMSMLRRFISRRGKPQNLYSDNGTTFVGANNELKELFDKLKDANVHIQQNLIKEGIEWHFIPPRSPNFGGLWEAGVKSAKYHLKRVVKDQKFTYEEMNTVLTQVEAVLNSRPLSPLSSDPNDYSPLTPGHFLIGRALTALPETDLTETPDNRLNKFQLQQKAIQHFWKRWHKEYISELQTRLKWKRNVSKILKIDQLVLLKDDSQSPFNWKMGRVIQLHPGADNVIRVATVRLSNGTELRRAVSNLCILPLEKPTTPQEQQSREESESVSAEEEKIEDN